MRNDLPTIGPSTVKIVHERNFHLNCWFDILSWKLSSRAGVRCVSLWKSVECCCTQAAEWLPTALEAPISQHPDPPPLMAAQLAAIISVSNMVLYNHPAYMKVYAFNKYTDLVSLYPSWRRLCGLWEILRWGQSILRYVGRPSQNCGSYYKSIVLVWQYW